MGIYFFPRLAMVKLDSDSTGRARHQLAPRHIPSPLPLQTRSSETDTPLGSSIPEITISDPVDDRALTSPTSARDGTRSSSSVLQDFPRDVTPDCDARYPTHGGDDHTDRPSRVAFNEQDIVLSPHSQASTLRVRLVPAGQTDERRQAKVRNRPATPFVKGQFSPAVVAVDSGDESDCDEPWGGSSLLAEEETEDVCDGKDVKSGGKDSMTMTVVVPS